MHSSREIKRFLANLIIFALLVYTLLYSVNFIYLMKYPEGENLVVAEGDRTRAEEINVIEDKKSLVANVGSSHGRDAFNYAWTESLGLPSANLAMNAQSLSYDYRIVEQFKKNFQEGGIVFIPISYFSYYLAEEEEDNFESKNMRYYIFLQYRYIKNYSLKNMAMVLFPILNAKANLFSPFEKSETEKPITEEDQKTPKERAEVDGEYAGHSHIEGSPYTINEEEVVALQRMIRLLKKEGVTPVLVTTPYLEEYRKYIPKARITEITDLTNKIAKEEGVKYYDYSSDPRFDGQYDLFSGANHLNKKGAELFVKILFEEIPQAQKLRQSRQ